MSTENTTTDTTESTDDSTDDVNLSRLREMAIKGSEYRETVEFEYYGEELELYVKPLTDAEFLPIAAVLEEKLDLDHEEAQEMIDDEMDDEGYVDPSAFDEEFIEVMQEAAILGIDTTQGDAEGEDEAGLRELVEMLQGGATLVIAERVLDISRDSSKAESFRRDGGSE